MRPSLYTAALTATLEAAREIKDEGTLGYIDRSVAITELSAFLEG